MIATSVTVSTSVQQKSTLVVANLLKSLLAQAATGCCQSQTPGLADLQAARPQRRSAQACCRRAMVRWLAERRSQIGWEC